MSNIFGSTLVDTADHHPMLRDSVGKLVGSFGRTYFQDVVKRKAKPVELWSAMGEAGFLGVQAPIPTKSPPSLSAMALVS